MKTTEKGKAIIKEFEGLHDGDLKTIGLQPKMDPVGIWTEGWGHAILDNKGNFIKGAANKALAYKYSKIKTVEEADKQLDIDLLPRELDVTRKLKISVTQNQFDALISHYYNTGGSATLFDLINSKSGKDKIYKWWTERYIMSDGKILPGLVKRRKKEADLYFS